MNRRLCGSGISPGFVALLFTVFDSTENRLSIANGGIPHPVLVRNGEVSDIPIDGTPLGLFREIEYNEHTIHMMPNDIVVLASDGITESMNAAGDLFGDERLADVLKKFNGDAGSRASSAEIAKAILTATDVFSGKPSEPHDDRTLIVLQLAPSEAKTV